MSDTTINEFHVVTRTPPKKMSPETPLLPPARPTKAKKPSATTTTATKKKTVKVLFA